MGALAIGLLVAGCADDRGDDEAADAAERAPTSTAAPAATTPPLTSRSLPTRIEAVPDLPGYRVYRPADLGATGAPLPVVVWANGGCVRHDLTWESLLERWAAAGFVVVAIAAPAEGRAETGATTADDQARAIDWAEAQAGESPFAGHLDRERVVAAGNSCGGVTALALAGQDERVRSVFVLSGSSVGPGAAREQAAAVMSQVSVPVGFAVGGVEDIAHDQAVQDVDVLPEGVPGFIASRAEGDHVLVSTDPGVLAEVAEIGINWLDFTLYGNEAARRAVTEGPCPDCAPDLWTVTTKDLDAVESP
jgi:dienelactone hydrolase